CRSPTGPVRRAVPGAAAAGHPGAGPPERSCRSAIVTATTALRYLDCHSHAGEYPEFPGQPAHRGGGRPAPDAAGHRDHPDPPAQRPERHLGGSVVNAGETGVLLIDWENLAGAILGRGKMVERSHVDDLWAFAHRRCDGQLNHAHMAAAKFDGTI